MEYLIGIMIGTAISLLGAFTGFDRDRSFYPTVLIVISTYYVLFAVREASPEILVTELAIAGGFLVAAIIGFRTSLWLVVAGLVTHGLFDHFHHLLADHSGVPDWWPGFCLTVDLTLGIRFAALLLKRPYPDLYSIPR
ncbi:MAG: hypothetical protein U5R46_08955 [Gammaproteobacteria bacterium]|nr:hypothetical protein [Gammaproteobacteria bacterium]